jgi:hypothetical protein
VDLVGARSTAAAGAVASALASGTAAGRHVEDGLIG